MAEPRKITIKLRPVGAKPAGITLKKPKAATPAAPAPEAPAAPAAEVPLEPLEELPDTPAMTPVAEAAPAAPETPVVAEVATPAAPETPAEAPTVEVPKAEAPKVENLKVEVTAPSAEQAKRQTSRIALPPELTQQPMSAPAASGSEESTIKLKPVSQAAVTATETPEATQANKSKTARIALDSVLGGIQTNTPLSNTTQKTIKLKRSAPKPASAAPSSTPAMTPVEGSKDASEDKTIKLKRPGSIGLKKPTLKTPAKPAKPAAGTDEPELETLETLDEADLAPITPMMAAPVEEESKAQKIVTSIAIVAAVASILLTVVLCVKLQYHAASANGSEPNGNTLHSLPFSQLF